MSTYFVASLKVEKVDRPEPVGSRHPDARQIPERDKTEVTQLTIKADTLAELITKLGKHIEIISE